MRALNDWFRENRRDFPWRLDPTPYKVWISEVMLQQTRASVVIPYFEKWMLLFPDIKTLADAKIEEVIKTWEGLGYYSRARNLHKGAQQILEEFGGEIPSSLEKLLKIQGLGPYTANAILSFGFKKRATPVDGNVTRVLARLFSIEENVSKQPVKKKIERGMEALLDHEEPWVTAEALIELGATICTPKPRCEICPLSKNCLGLKKAHLLPIKNEEPKIILLKRVVLWIQAQEKVLVKKEEKGKVMADLYQFPYFEMTEIWSLSRIEAFIESHFGVHPTFVERLPLVKHAFTKYKAILYPFRFCTETALEIQGHEWIEREMLNKLPFSSGHKRILEI